MLKISSFIQELTCSERTKNSSKIVSISLDGNTRISEAIKEVTKEMGINLISMELNKDKIYTNGFTCYNQGFQELRELVQDSESNKKAKSKKDDKWENEQKKKTIKESNKYDYTIECFPIHYIKKGDVIYVESDDVSGFMQVEEVSISLSDSWNMKLGVKVMKDDGKHKDNSSKNTKNKKG